MKWARRFRARLRAALRAALGAWRLRAAYPDMEFLEIHVAVSKLTLAWGDESAVNAIVNDASRIARYQARKRMGLAT